MTQRFEYGVSRISDFAVRTTVNRRGQTEVTEMLLDGRPVQPTGRFWNSLHLRFGFTSNIFRYFRPDEVFQRISQTTPHDRVRWCVEWNDDHGRLLAVTSPTAGLVPHADLVGLLRHGGAEKLTYSEGVVSSTHAPHVSSTFAVGGDDFQNKFVINTPIDGFGRPQVYLALLRLICSNGAVAMTPVFRSEVNVGRGARDTAFALGRVLDGFNNEEGYTALRQRFESATRSWASVNEVNALYRTLTRAQTRGGLRRAGGDGAALDGGRAWQRGFRALTGDLSQVYGLANLDVLSVKRQRTLPAACKVYDLLNFASEMATHHAAPEGSRALNAYLGDLIASEFDLEGTAEHFSDWRDFFIGHADTTATLTSLQ